MAGINKVILVGNLGQDPESKTTTSGSHLTTVSIATSESWKDKNTGKKQEKTEWHKVVFTGRLAEIAAQYLRKGSKVYVEGKLQTHKWTDQGGVDHYTTQIYVRDFQMLDSRESNTGGYQQQQPAQAAPQQAPQQQPAPGFDDFDDDITF